MNYLNKAEKAIEYLAESEQEYARLKGLGNAVVPQIPELIGRAILENTKS